MEFSVPGVLPADALVLSLGRHLGTNLAEAAAGRRYWADVRCAPTAARIQRFEDMILLQ